MTIVTTIVDFLSTARVKINHFSALHKLIITWKTGN